MTLGNSAPSTQIATSLHSELGQADRLYEAFLSRVRCNGVHHFSAALALEELAKCLNSFALRRLEAEQTAEARTVLLLAEKQMHTIGKQFYDTLKKQSGSSSSAVGSKQGEDASTSAAGGGGVCPSQGKGRRKSFRQAFAMFANLTLNNLASVERKAGSLAKSLKYLCQSKMWVGRGGAVFYWLVM